MTLYPTLPTVTIIPKHPAIVKFFVREAGLFIPYLHILKEGIL